MQRYLLALVSFLFVTTLSAETCPTVQTIKNAKLTDWQFYDSEDDKKLDAKQVTAYKKLIHKFVLAEYKNHPKAIHCYYSDREGSGLEVYVGKYKNFQPEHSKHWYQVTGASQCIASMEKCRFEAATKHFANR